MKAYKNEKLKPSSCYHCLVWPVVPVPQLNAPPRVQDNVVGGGLRASLTTKIRRLPLPRDTLDREYCKK